MKARENYPRQWELPLTETCVRRPGCKLAASLCPRPSCSGVTQIKLYLRQPDTSSHHLRLLCCAANLHHFVHAAQSAAMPCSAAIVHPMACASKHCMATCPGKQASMHEATAAGLRTAQDITASFFAHHAGTSAATGPAPAPVDVANKRALSSVSDGCGC